MVQCSCRHCKYKKLHGWTEVHVSEWQRKTPRSGTGWYPGSSQILRCCVNWGDLEQSTALVEPEDENPDAVVERPRLTTSALKKGWQTANDSVNYYVFSLTSSWIGDWNSSTRWRLSWHLARRCLSAQRRSWKQPKKKTPLSSLTRLSFSRHSLYVFRSSW